MIFAFDLISDLHVETWDSFDWTGQATSPFCVVAGDVARDRQTLISTLTHLGQCYPGGVFYTDGNDEHRYYLDDLGKSYKNLTKEIKSIPNVIYMHDHVVVVDGVAIVATNGWWSYDFDPHLDFEQSVNFAREHFQISAPHARNIASVSHQDAAYLINSVRKLQTHKEVSAIVLVTHTVPGPWLIQHDLDLVDHWRFNGMGNSEISRAVDVDHENKIKAWCFGHYHRPVDQYYNNVRYVTNPRGRGNTPWNQSVFYAKRIEIEF
jgi:hypothetical protein